MRPLIGSIAIPSEQTNLATQREWRELGFYYDRNDELREWRIEGSLAGLNQFSARLAAYSTDPRNATLSEHEHFGPYWYLEVGTWHEPVITDHWIAGTLDQILALAELISRSLDDACPGTQMTLREDFSPGSAYELRLIVREPDFDPARADSACW